MKKYATVLAIAGTDPSGGAGIQADIKSISANGAYAMSAITAVVSQNTTGVSEIYQLPIETICSQINAVLTDIMPDAVKIGMLHSCEVIEAVSNVLRKYNISNIVTDPVMVATSGDRLLSDDAVVCLENVLIPQSRLITPNIPEAEVLLGYKINDIEQMKKSGIILAERYGVSVLVKGGHADGGELSDILINIESDEIEYFRSKKINTVNTHGTGCTLSSAIASFLAKGESLSCAVKSGLDYVHQAIVSGASYKIGHGHGPVNHFYMFEK